MFGHLQIEPASRRYADAVTVAGQERSKPAPSNQKMNERLDVLAGKTQRGAGERFIVVIVIAKMGTAIDGQANPFIEEEGSLSNESALGIAELELHGNPELCAGNAIRRIHPGVPGKNLHFC